MARRAMATTFEVVVPLGTPDALELGREALNLIDELENQLTVYRPASEVSQLNRQAPYRPVVVEPGLSGLLQLAARLNAETEGAFDITAGALIKAWGFYRGPRRVPADKEIAEALRHVGMDQVTLDPPARSVRYGCPGLEINLGSIGKGYALDRTAARIKTYWDESAFLVHGGFSSVYACGFSPADRRGWPVDICHPWKPQRKLARVWLCDQALGTSAATFQYLEHQGRKLGHVLDPRTGWPASGIASATVLAPSAAEADALSTALFILGVDAAADYCKRHPQIGAILLAEGDDAQPVLLGQAADEATVLRDRPACLTAN
jgi:thiamine biosynthesis lipoprotein